LGVRDATKRDRELNGGQINETGENAGIDRQGVADERAARERASVSS
jgi:hypothetical protein